MRIRTKLILSFTAIVLLNICFGFYAIHALSSINARVEETNEWSAAIAQLGELDMYISHIRRYDLNYVIQLKPDNAFLQKRTDARMAFEQLLQQYKYDVQTLEYDFEADRQAELSMLGDIAANWNAYMLLSDNIIAMTDKGRREEAAAIAGDESLSVFDALEAGVRKLSDFNIKGSEAQLEISAGIYNSSKMITIAILSAASVFSVLVTCILIRNIKRAVNELLRVSQALGSGDFTVVSSLDSADEFGLLSNQYNVTIGSVKLLISGAQTSAQDLAESAEKLNTSAASTAKDSELIAANARKVSGLTREQFSEIESMTKTIQEVSAQVSDTSKNIDDLTRSALLSTEKAAEGSSFIRKAITQMKLIEDTVNASAQVVDTLGDRSSEIGEIVETISSISSQTNLLALNAAIEAARAGAHGLGFAVVADEVKELARESKVAADKIGQLISSIQDETKRAVDAMRQGKAEVQKGSGVVAQSGQAFDALAKTSSESSGKIEKLSSVILKMVEWNSVIVAAVGNVKIKSDGITKEAESMLGATEGQTAAMRDVSSSSKTLAEISQDMLEATRQFKVL